MSMNVVLYGDEILEKRAEPIEGVDEETRELIERMVETMYAYEGIGLAANQVGSLKRVAVVDPSGGEDEEALMVLINPEIIAYGKETEKMQEGCLSFPEIRFEVDRPTTIRLRTQTLDGETVELDADGLLARVFQHEVDHLNGVLFIDYLRGLQKQMVMTRIKNMKKRGEWE